MSDDSTSEQVVALLRETADKIESGDATLSRASHKHGYGHETSELQIEWWDTNG